MTALRVALTNDYDLVLHGLTSLLRPHADQVTVVQQSTGMVSPDADVILYDTFGRLPGDDPRLKEIASTNRATVIVYSWDFYPPGHARASGAAGYIHKGLSGADVVRSILAIRHGRAWESPTPSLYPASAETDQTWPGKAQGLTSREAEVLALVARGHSNQEIADQSYVSINTVKMHVRGAYRKIGVTRRPQAVSWALRNGFTLDDDG